MRFAALSLLVPTLAFAQGQVTPTVQTTPALVGTQSAAAGAGLYVTPDGGLVVLANNADPSQAEGLHAYDVTGQQLAVDASGPQVAVDVRYGYGFPTKRDAILMVDGMGVITLFGLDLMAGQFVPLSTDGTSVKPTQHNAQSAALGWHNSKLSAYLGSASGNVEQWLLTPISDDTMDISKVGSVSVGAGRSVRAMVADEQTDTLFLSIDSVGLVSLPLQIDGGISQLKFLDAGVLSAPSGLSLYLQSDGGAILLASDKNNALIEAFDRKGTFLGNFKIVGDGGILGVTAPVGNAVLMTDAGENLFPQGVFAVVDANDPGGPRVKLVPWQKIAASFSPPLVVDTSFDVRKLPHAAPVPMMVCDAGTTDGGDDGGTDAGMSGCGGAGGGSGGGAGGGSGTGGNHMPPTMGMPYTPKGCGCDGSAGALLGGLALLGLALRRRLEVSRSRRFRS